MIGWCYVCQYVTWQFDIYCLCTIFRLHQYGGGIPVPVPIYSPVDGDKQELNGSWNWPIRSYKQMSPGTVAVWHFPVGALGLFCRASRHLTNNNVNSVPSAGCSIVFNWQSSSRSRLLPRPVFLNYRFHNCHCDFTPTINHQRDPVTRLCPTAW